MRMSSNELYACWAEIDLSAIRGNVQTFRMLTGVDVIAVVKANAYGHGAVESARAALAGGASRLAVARVEEALELRRAGIEAPILILGWTPPGRLVEMILESISLTMWSKDQLEAASSAAGHAGKEALIHIKVDTGMSRIGVQPSHALEVIRACDRLPGCRLEGLFTHFARADEPETATTHDQHGRFLSLLEQIEADGIQPEVIHAANSAASIRFPETWHSAIRVGIAMYGLLPSPDCPLPEGFRPALSWKSALVQVKDLPPGRGISYGHIYHTRQAERIGTVAVGYADGYRRTDGNEVLVAGRRCPVVGRVTMDQIMVNLDAVPEARPGMEVVLLGEQDNDRISAEEIGERWGTINYEVTSAIAQRVVRIYP
jgi:alanine racemase